MKNYIVYDSTGKILRVGVCSNKDLSLQKKENEFVMEGIANDLIQKINITTKQIIDKTPEEIEVEKPQPISIQQQQARITNAQYQTLKDRITALEAGG